MMKPLKVLVACEFSGTVRDAFAAQGHHAVSCDLLPSEKPGKHYQGDVRDILHEGWDMMIAHPPCTHLAVSGARWFSEKRLEQAEALDFVRLLLDAPIPMIALENPVSVISTKIRKPDQIVQPWWFGHGETKATCLWLKNLPPLVPTRIVVGRQARVHRMTPGPNRWKERSRTLSGMASAMADQWGHPELGMAGPAGLPRGEQGVKRSSATDAKASGCALPREGQRPLSFQRLGILVATIVAGLTVTGCAERRALRAEGEYVEGGVLSRPLAREIAKEECRPVRRSVVFMGRGGDVRREITDIPGVC